MTADPGAQALRQSALLIAHARELRQAGQLQQAVTIYQQAIGACPGNSAAYQGLVTLLLDAGDIANAAKVMNAVPPAVYRQAAALHNLHAIILIHLGQLDGAIQILERLQGVDGINQGSLFNNLAACYDRKEDYARAPACFEKALRAGKDDPDLYMGWAGTCQKMGDVANAERLYTEGLRKYPRHSELPYEYAVLLLKSGQYAKGFALYDHRWQARVFAQNRRPELPLPHWDGTTGIRSLLVMPEQGVGDEIVFSALLPALLEKVPSVSVALDVRLAPLLERSWPALAVAEPVAGMSAAELAAHFDAWIPAGDLGRLAPEGIGWTGGPLRADPVRTAALRERYQERFPGKRLVGISWKSKRAAFGARKSIDLLDWKPLLEQQDCQFISLQYGEVAEEVARVREALGITVHVDPAIDSFQDLDGLAAQISALDQIITTSNTTAHLAGGLHAPTWVLLPIGPALLWYWGYGERSAWYPDVRLFRLQSPGEWGDVMARVAQALAKEVASPGGVTRR